MFVSDFQNYHLCRFLINLAILTVVITELIIPSTKRILFVVRHQKSTNLGEQELIRLYQVIDHKEQWFHHMCIIAQLAYENSFCSYPISNKSRLMLFSKMEPTQTVAVQQQALTILVMQQMNLVTILICTIDDLTQAPMNVNLAN